MAARTRRPPRDDCLVPTAPLAAALVTYCARWRTTRPSTRGQIFSAERGPSGIDPLTPYEGIAFQIGDALGRQGWPLPRQGRGKPDPLVEMLKKVRNPRRYPLCELRVADALTDALDSPQWFYDGTLAVYGPLDCCGGSQDPYRDAFAAFCVASTLAALDVSVVRMPRAATPARRKRPRPPALAAA